MKRSHAFAIFAICGSIFLALIVIEVGYRTKLFIDLGVNADYPGVATADIRLPREEFMIEPGNVFGPFPPNTTFTLTHFTADNEPYNRHKIHANNLGWKSRYEYRIEKAKDEFRIVIVGASLAANPSSENSWADALQDNLNRDDDLLRALQVSRISVLNIARAGAPLQYTVEFSNAMAKRFSPDLLLFNFSSFDIMTVDTTHRLRPIQRDDERRHRQTPAPADHPGVYSYALEIESVAIRYFCVVKDGALAKECSLHPVWSVDPALKLDRRTITDIKARVARAVLVKRVWLNWRPLLILKLLGKPVLSQADAAETIEAQISFTMAAFTEIHRQFVRSTFVSSPLLWAGDQDISINQETARRGKRENLDVVDMAEHLPIGNDWKNWYVLDGHWSDEGISIYAEALTQAIKQRILKDQASAQSAPSRTSFENSARHRAPRTTNPPAKSPGASQ